MKLLSPSKLDITFAISALKLFLTYFSETKSKLSFDRLDYNVYSYLLIITESQMIKKLLIGFIILTLYLISSVPVGLFIYSLKTENNINIFSKTGFHSYLSCLKNEAHKTISEEKL